MFAIFSYYLSYIYKSINNYNIKIKFDATNYIDSSYINIAIFSRE